MSTNYNTLIIKTREAMSDTMLVAGYRTQYFTIQHKSELTESTNQNVFVENSTDRSNDLSEDTTNRSSDDRSVMSFADSINEEFIRHLQHHDLSEISVVSSDTGHSTLSFESANPPNSISSSRRHGLVSPVISSARSDYGTFDSEGEDELDLGEEVDPPQENNEMSHPIYVIDMVAGPGEQGQEVRALLDNLIHQNIITAKDADSMNLQGLSQADVVNHLKDKQRTEAEEIVYDIISGIIDFDERADIRRQYIQEIEEMEEFFEMEDIEEIEEREEIEEMEEMEEIEEIEEIELFNGFGNDLQTDDEDSEDDAE